MSLNRSKLLEAIVAKEAVTLNTAKSKLQVERSLFNKLKLVIYISS